MSGTEDRALRAAAEALHGPFIFEAGEQITLTKVPLSAEQMARICVAAYLDSLLGELPEQAVEAAAEELRQYLGHSWQKPVTAHAVIMAALQSLRGSLNTGGGV